MRSTPNLNAYVGLPWSHGGRDRSGCDCWGLVRLVYADRLGLDVGDRPDRVDWIAIAAGDECAFDVVLMRERPWHVGIVVAPGLMLHMQEGKTSVVEPYTTGRHARRVEGFYRWAECMPAVTDAPAPVPLAATAEPEIMPPGERLSVVAAMHPMRPGHTSVDVPLGSSLSEIVDACLATGRGGKRARRNIRIMLGGEPVPQALWPRIRPKRGVNIVVRAVPSGGSGGILKSILQIALLVVATAVFGPGGLALSAGFAAAATAAVMFVGGLLLNALFPAAASSSNDTKTVYSIAGTRNAISKWGPIPVLLGRGRIAPKLAASPYTEFAGDDQVLRLLLVWGQGPIEIGALKIGETDIGDFTDVEVQTREGYATDAPQTIYTAEVVQDDMQVELTSHTPTTRTSAEDAAEIAVDLVAPQGIYDVNLKKGGKSNLTVQGSIALLATGTETVIASQNWNFTAASEDPIRRTYRFSGLSGGPYDVRVTRSTPDDDAPDHQDTVALTAIRTYRNSPPIEYSKPLAITALRIRATKQLSGTPDDINAICTSRCLSWNGSAWVPNVATRSPADLYRLVLQGPGNARPAPDEQIDLPTIQRWADSCIQKGWTFDLWRDFGASVRDTLKDVCAAGRAVYLLRDGLHSVAFEDDFAPIVQHFTPRNSRDFSFVQNFRTLPHGLRCKFVNATKGWIEDEKLVFDDGYTKANATLYEQAEFPGVTDPDLIYKHARYRIAEARLRPAVYTLTVDAEHLVCTRGDRVLVAHDVMLKGLFQGRIRAIQGQVATLDEEVYLDPGQSYGIRIRLSTGASIVRTVSMAGVTVAHWTDQVTVTGSLPTSAAGCLFMMGLSGEETGTYRILTIKPGEDLSATIEFVDDAPGIQVSDTGPIVGGPGTVVPPVVIARPVITGLAAYIDSGSGGYQLVASYARARGATRYVGETSLDGGTTWVPAYEGTATRWTVPVSRDNLQVRVAAYGTELGPWSIVSIAAADYPARLVDYDDLEADLKAQVDLATNDANGSLADLRDRLRDALDEVAVAQSAHARYGLDQRDVIRETINAVAGTSAAAITDEEVARASGDVALATRIVTLDAATSAATAQLRKQIGVRVDGAASLTEDVETLRANTGTDIAASVLIEATARTDTDSALAQAISTLRANTGTDIVAAVLLESTARSGTDSALATQIGAVLAETHLATASGYYKLEATAAGPDSSARFEVYLNAGTPEAPSWSQAGLILEVTSGGASRILLISDQLVIAPSRSASASLPFIVSEGTVYIDNAMIRDLTADNIDARSISGDRLTIGGVDISELTVGAVTGTATLEGNGTVALNVRDGVVQILLRGSSLSGNQTGFINLVRDGTYVDTEFGAYITGGTPIGGSNFSGGGRVQNSDGSYTNLRGDTPFYLIIDQPPPGAHTYSVLSFPNTATRMTLLNLRR